MQSVSACLPRPATAEDLACRRESLGSHRPRGYITARIRPQWECERGNFAPCRSIYRKNRSTPSKRRAARLLRRANANRDQWRIRRTWHRTAGSASFAEELRLIARCPAVSGDQDFIVLAFHRAPRNAVRSYHSDAWAGRTWRPFFTLQTWRTRRPPPGRSDPHRP